MRKISIIGCGVIGSAVAAAVDRGLKNIYLASIYDLDKDKSVKLSGKLKNSLPKICDDMQQAIDEADLIFESTQPYAVRDIAEKAIESKKDLFIMSVGSLIIYPEILNDAKVAGCKIYFPSGAIAGLDAISACSLAEIKRVELKTTKPLKSLMNSPGLNRFLENSKTKVEDIKAAQEIFEGNAREAIELFPQNVNVSAALSIVGAGPEKTSVKIVADPFGTQNIHEITVDSNAGTVYTKTQNIPSPQNPKTSYLAILSAIDKLRVL